MFRTEEGSSGRLLQLCVAYFAFYAVTGVAVKYFQGSAGAGFPGMAGMEFLLYSTLGGAGIALAVVLARGWFRVRSEHTVTFGPFTFPREILYIVPSGVCTAVVIPTTTLMYSLPISVMVAMVMMRGSVIVISRVVDAVQARQGILKKKVYAVEDLAVAFALGAVAIEPLAGSREGGFDFMQSRAAVTILGSYIAAYAVRIYIMNYYKNTRPRGMPLDNRGFFGVEQIAASVAMALVGVAVFAAGAGAGGPAEAFRGAVLEPHPMWPWAVLAGTAYGMVAFFSVFIFMFQGRTATFAGLVNRLTSLVAGTAATLIFAASFGGRWPGWTDWASLALILVSVAFLTVAERRRSAEALAERAGAVAAPVRTTVGAP